MFGEKFHKWQERKKEQKLSTDIESKILNDLDDKIYHLSELTIARSELAEIFIGMQDLSRLKKHVQCML